MNAPISITATATEIHAARPTHIDPGRWQDIRNRTSDHLDQFVARLRADRP
jgi:hypothetical protein